MMTFMAVMICFTLAFDEIQLDSSMCYLFTYTLELFISQKYNFITEGQTENLGRCFIKLLKKFGLKLVRRYSIDVFPMFLNKWAKEPKGWHRCPTVSMTTPHHLSFLLFGVRPNKK